MGLCRAVRLALANQEQATLAKQLAVNREMDDDGPRRERLNPDIGPKGRAALDWPKGMSRLGVKT